MRADEARVAGEREKIEVPDCVTCISSCDCRCVVKACLRQQRPAWITWPSAAAEATIALLDDSFDNNAHLQ